MSDSHCNETKINWAGRYRRGMNITTRLAQPGDARRIAEIHVTGWRHTYADLLSSELLDGMSIERHESGWSRRLDAGEPVHVALIDTVVVGFAYAGPSRGDAPPHDLELYAIYQLPEAHGSGTGQVLLDAAIGNAPAFLWVADPNPRAQAFYRKNRFQPDGASHVDPDLDGLREIRMIR